MKILITGGRGFVGAATIEQLTKEGHDIFNYDLMDGHDIQRLEHLDEAFDQFRPDRVLHLAAIARFADADRNPQLAFATNVNGTLNVLEACAKYMVPLVYSSTGSAIMPLNGYPPPYTEDIPARGNSVYGCTKALAERYVAEHTPHIILRYAHLYGREKRHHGLIGGFKDRIERGLQPTLYGGEQTNDFVYIKDVVQANIKALLATWDKWNQIYNVGSGHELTAKEAGQAICDVMGYQGEMKIEQPRTVDAERFCFDITKIQTMLGYEPKFTFEQGLRDMFHDK